MRKKKVDPTAIAHAAKILAGMPCTNRETAAEKAAAHEWLKKEIAGRRTKHLQIAEKFRQERETAAVVKR